MAAARQLGGKPCRTRTTNIRPSIAVGRVRHSSAALYAPLFNCRTVALVSAAAFPAFWCAQTLTTRRQIRWHGFSAGDRAIFFSAGVGATKILDFPLAVGSGGGRYRLISNEVVRCTLPWRSKSLSFHCLFHHFLGSRGGRRAATNDLHSTGFWANHFTSLQFLPSSLISLSTNLLQFIFSLPRFPFPQMFHSKASRLMSFGLPRVLLSNQTSSRQWCLQQESLVALLLNSSFIISSVVKSLAPCLCNELTYKFDTFIKNSKTYFVKLWCLKSKKSRTHIFMKCKLKQIMNLPIIVYKHKNNQLKFVSPHQKCPQ